MKKIFRKIRSVKKGDSSKLQTDFDVEKLKPILKYKPKNSEPYIEAFTHSSMREKNSDGSYVNYERLEYLGDAMLGSIVAAFLFDEFPGSNEGFLTQMRSKIVSRDHLNKLGKDLNLVQFVRSNVSRSKIGNNINGNLFEALIGAIYLDKGYLFCEKFVRERILENYVDLPLLEGKISSYKSIIVEWTQKHKKDLRFEVYEDSGNQHQKHFSVRLFIDEKVISKGRATSKKKAEEIASRRAYFVLQDQFS
ncbi:MAG: ribonuclease III [Flavobacteriaceae bacterium]